MYYKITALALVHNLKHTTKKEIESILNNEKTQPYAALIAFSLASKLYGGSYTSKYAHALHMNPLLEKSDIVPKQNPLDGITILRLAKYYDSISGLSSALQNMNYGLVNSSNCKIIQIYEATKDVKRQIPPNMNWHNSTQITEHRMPHYIEPSKITLKLKQIFNDNHIDLFLINGLIDFVTTSASITTARGYNKHLPIILQHHLINSRLNQNQFGELKTIFHKVDGVGLLTEHAKHNEMLEFNHKYQIFPDGINISFFSPEKAKPETIELSNTDPNTINILLPARICKHKGHMDMVKIANILKNKDHNFHIYYAGPIENKQVSFNKELEQLISKLELNDTITGLGALTQKKLRDYYAKCHIVILPTHTEGLGTVLLEAQAMRKPIITNKTGGTPAIFKSTIVIKDKTDLSKKLSDNGGFLIDFNIDIKSKKSLKNELEKNINLFADALEHLILNPSTRKQMGLAGQTYIRKKFNIDSLVIKLQNYYRKVLDTPINASDLEDILFPFIRDIIQKLPLSQVLSKLDKLLRTHHFNNYPVEDKTRILRFIRKTIYK